MTPELSRRLGLALGTHRVSPDERERVIADIGHDARTWDDLSPTIRDLVEQIEDRPLL